MNRMNFVEKHSKLLAVALCLCASGPILSTVHAYEVQPGWHSDGEVSYYILDNHERAKGLTEIEGETYCFNGNGEMQTGWHNQSNTIFYFGNDGRAVTGVAEVSGSMYNFQDDGSLMQGWEDDSYYNEKGFMETDTWIKSDGSKYYVDDEGTLLKDEMTEVDGNDYLFDPEGRVVVGMFSIEEEQFVTDDTGVVQKAEFVQTDQGIVYATETGALNTESFAMIGDDLYAFNEDGYLLSNEIVDDYFVNNDGIATLIEPEQYDQFVQDFYEAQDQSQDISHLAEQLPPVEEPSFSEEIFYTTPEPVYTPELVDQDYSYEAPVHEDYSYEEPVFEEIIPEPVYDEQYFYEEAYPEESYFDETAQDNYYYEDIVSDQIGWESPAEFIVEEPEILDQEWTDVYEEPVIWEDYTEDYYQDYDNQQFEDWYVEESQGYSSDVASIVLGAAYAQIGVHQSCTELVSNALAAAGISFYGWPEEYASLGTYTSNPVPGDLIIYSGHVAVYAGDGMAIHGGWDGYTTALASVNCSQALIGYIHI